LICWGFMVKSHGDWGVLAKEISSEDSGLRKKRRKGKAREKGEVRTI